MKKSTIYIMTATLTVAVVIFIYSDYRHQQNTLQEYERNKERLDSISKSQSPSEQQINQWENEKPLLISNYRSSEDQTMQEFDMNNIDVNLKWYRIIHRGAVYLTIKDFRGYGLSNIPFVGSVQGNIQSLFVDGKQFKFKSFFLSHEDLYFRKDVYLRSGYNRIPIKVINNKGKVLETYLEITMGKY
jgi:hypothetical protein